jgi:signal transduction histidine kinase
MGGMLGYSSALRERRREQLATLNNWPGPDPSQINSPNIANLLGHCARALEARRTLVLWEEAEEPFVNIAVWDHGRYEHTREMAGSFGDFVRSAQHVETAFWTDDAASLFGATIEGPMRLSSPILDEGMINAFRIRGVASAPFAGALCRGRVFILDRSGWSDFQLQLTQILASRIGNALDREIMQVHAKEAVAGNERARLTRDLHDGLLQNLTAASLQLKILADHEKGEVQARLGTIREMINKEQRRIRDFVRTSSRRDTDVEIVLKAALQEVLSEAARLWNCTTSLSVQPACASAQASLCVHLSLMLAEAVANAVRHGRAKNVAVSIEKGERELAISVRDNGRGFPGDAFRFDGRELAVAEKSPLSLGERVRELGGLLSVNSTPDGVELQIQLPLR